MLRLATRKGEILRITEIPTNTDILKDDGNFRERPTKDITKRQKNMVGGRERRKKESNKGTQQAAPELTQTKLLAANTAKYLRTEPANTGKYLDFEPSLKHCKC